jgi:hypothetical protein
MVKHSFVAQLGRLLRRYWIVALCVAGFTGVLWIGAPAWAAPVTRPLNQTVPRPTPSTGGDPVATATPLPDDGDGDSGSNEGGANEVATPGQPDPDAPNIIFPQQTAEAAGTETSGESDGTAAAPSDEPTALPSATPTPGSVIETDVVIEAEEPVEQFAGPVRLEIPELDLDVPVIAMGWRVEVVDGERTTVWDVPLEEAGWHINSMGAGGPGNTIISGRQVEGDAVFALLALGSVVPGQEILLTDGDGITFVYRVTEVTEPIPVTGATKEETEQAAAYFAPTDEATLTLVTGWPDFTTTHRVFAVAELEEELSPSDSGSSNSSSSD